MTNWRIDTHAHCFLRDLPLAPVRRYAPAYDAALETYLAKLDQAGLSHGVLIQPSFLGTDNSYLLASLRRAGGRLRGVVMLSPDTEANEIRALDAVGVVGVRLNLIGLDSPDLSTARWRRHLRLLADLGWQVEIQSEARRLPALLPSLLNLGLTVVVDHFARPDAAAGVDDPGFRGLLALARRGNVWIKLSGAYRLGGAGQAMARQAAPLLLDAFGPDRLLWGSDWPHTQFEAQERGDMGLGQLAQWVADPAVQAGILGDNAARLFRFQQDKSQMLRNEGGLG